MIGRRLTPWHDWVFYAVEEGPRGRVVQFDTVNLYNDSIEVIE